MIVDIIVSHSATHISCKLRCRNDEHLLDRVAEPSWDRFLFSYKTDLPIGMGSSWVGFARLLSSSVE